MREGREMEIFAGVFTILLAAAMFGMLMFTSWSRRNR
jgi:hypothetical protein